MKEAPRWMTIHGCQAHIENVMRHVQQYLKQTRTTSSISGRKVCRKEAAKAAAEAQLKTLIGASDVLLTGEDEAPRRTQEPWLDYKTSMASARAPLI